MTRRRIVYSSLAGIVLVSTAVINFDPIYRLSFYLSINELGLRSWEFGLGSMAKGPRSASASELLRASFPDMVSEIVEERTVPVLGMGGWELCPAALVRENGGLQIELFYWRNGQWTMKTFLE